MTTGFWLRVQFFSSIAWATTVGFSAPHHFVNGLLVGQLANLLIELWFIGRVIRRHWRP